jgi:hypothetical protein
VSFAKLVLVASNYSVKTAQNLQAAHSQRSLLASSDFFVKHLMLFLATPLMKLKRMMPSNAALSRCENSAKRKIIFTYAREGVADINPEKHEVLQICI